jgi:hypothetical protein
MADMDYFGAEYDGSTPASGRPVRVRRRASRLVGWAGAATSVGLLAVTGAWAVDIALRDVTDVPVIRAAEGPARVAPEDPGGASAPYQGLALSEITSGGAAAPSPERIALAPEAAVLSAPSIAERAERVAALEAASSPAAPASGPAAPAPASLAASVGTLAPQDPLTAPAAPQGVDVAMLTGPEISGDAGPAISDVSAGVADLIAQLAAEAQVELPAAAEPVAEMAALVQPDAAPAPLVRASYRPAPRPPVWRAAAPAPAAPAAPAAGPVVQVGAFDSEALARAEWDRLAARFGPEMAGKQRLIARADGSGGRAFWRLRVVGFDGPAEADRFCSALMAARTACIPVGGS